MHPIFIGSHPAIDFLNTALAPDGAFIEAIPDGRALLDWLVGAGLLEASAATRLSRRRGAKAVDDLASEARKLREWARAWLERWRAAPDRGYAKELASLNKLLEGASFDREVVAEGGVMSLRTRPRIGSDRELLGLLAAQIANLLTQEQADLVKSCAGPGCTLWFLDRTKAHRRLFCSPAVCGNRAKVAAFRKRQRV